MHSIFKFFSLKCTKHARNIVSLYRISSQTVWTPRVNYYSTMNKQPIFQGTEDRFKGITVDTRNEKCEIKDLSVKLEDSLKSWKETNKRGIWFRVALENADWVPILANNGFKFHHANEGYVMMYCWLPSESCGIPPYAHTMLAVGAIVVNDQSEILVVQEKHVLTGHWKFPGGMVEPGENLIDAVVREVKEETNIKAEFKTVIALTHADKGTFGCSDLYVVMALHALSNEIKKCDREIMKCQWFNIHEYLKRDDVTHLNKHLLQKYLEYQKSNIKIDFEKGFHQISKRAYITYSTCCNEMIFK